MDSLDCIRVLDNCGCIYYSGKWAEIVSFPFELTLGSPGELNYSFGVDPYEDLFGIFAMEKPIIIKKSKTKKFNLIIN